MKIYDIAVVGSGFAGSLFAMIARRLGRSVILLERGKHPRVVIGESTTPLSNLLLEEMADRYELAGVRPLTKWGSWQRSHPELGCGLKRGFSFYHHDLSESQRERPPGSEFLVAASPHDEIADTHWYRADVDEYLVREAREMGVSYVDGVCLDQVRDTGEEVLLDGSRDGARVNYAARFVVDATGPRGFLHSVLGLGESVLPDYPQTVALYSHFSGVRRLDSFDTCRDVQRPPYPIDDAAVHHVFDGGWIWVLQFGNGVTSAGVAATAECAERLGLAGGEAAWRGLLARIPVLTRQFAEAKRVQPFTFVPRLAFRTAEIVGERWAMLPSAAGFVDPLLSTGIPLALLGVNRLAEIVAESWGAPQFAGRLSRYAKTTDEELLATARLISTMYGRMNDFRTFQALSMMYFAAASYSETARRLGRNGLAESFLLYDRDGFGQRCRDLLSRRAGGVDAAEVERAVYEMIEPIDVAGLCRRKGEAWYPVAAEDLIDSAWKLGAMRDEVVQLLERAGFFATHA